MKAQLSLRNSLVVLIFGSTLLTLGKVALFPATANQPPTSFSFPEQVSLPEWQPVSHQALASLDVGDSQSISGRQYEYTNNDTSIKIEMFYFVNTDGDVEGFLRSQTPNLQLQNSQRKQTDSGYYLLFVKQERAYLSACINPHGGTTVSGVQFKQNRNTADIPNRLLPWLLGQGQLKDERCLWANLSLPLRQSSPDRAYQTLETVWSSWQPWWQQHFPQP